MAGTMYWEKSFHIHHPHEISEIYKELTLFSILSLSKPHKIFEIVEELTKNRNGIYAFYV